MFDSVRGFFCGLVFIFGVIKMGLCLIFCFLR